MGAAAPLHDPPSIDRGGTVRGPRRSGLIGAYLLLVLVTLAAYAPLVRNGFVSYDDNQYVTDNEMVLGGLTRAGWTWAWTARHASNWHPLTWLSHMLDTELFGRESALGPHLINLFWHLATVLMLARFLTLATGRSWPTFAVAALVALHPLNVECVAWVSQRKSVLSSFFWFAALTAWVRWVERRSLGWYALSWVATALGLLAKPMLVSLPLAMLLVDLWPLGRAASARTLARLILEKTPFFLAVAGLALATLWAQQKAISDESRLALPIRLANALIAYASYLRLAAWPSGLAVFYPHPMRMPPLFDLAWAAALLGSITVLAWWLRRRSPAVPMGWAWYLLTLVPTVGLVQVGIQSMADRYAYLPLVGVFVAVVWPLAAWARRRPMHRALAGIGSAAALGLAALTFRQTRVWRDSSTLFEHALAVTEGNYIAHAHLARVDLARQQPALAVEHLEAARRLGWQPADMLVALASLRWNEGRRRECRNILQQVLARSPRHIGALLQLAKLARREHDQAEAERLLRRVLEIDPGHAEASALLRADTESRSQPPSPDR